jgi:hypothetical protein
MGISVDSAIKRSLFLYKYSLKQQLKSLYTLLLYSTPFRYVYVVPTTVNSGVDFLPFPILSVKSCVFNSTFFTHRKVATLATLGVKAMKLKE